MKTVKDVMSPVVFCLEESMLLPEAAQSLRDHTISGAPVINSDGHYVGVLSQTDVNSQIARAFEAEEDTGSFNCETVPAEFHSMRVGDIMTSQILKISSQASLEELGKALLVGGVHRLLVVEGEEIIGLVTTTDLIHGLLSPDGDSSREPVRPAPKPYLFETELVCDEGTVRLKSAFGPEITLEAPPEFGGSGRYMSPEDLFVASLSSCLCLTFHELAERAGLRILDYRCRAIGRLEGDGVSQRFTRVDLYPRIQVDGSVQRTEQVLGQAKLRCLVGRSSDVIAVLHPKIEERTFQEN